MMADDNMAAAQDHSQRTNISLLEQIHQSYELHFDPEPHREQQALPPVRFRVRRHWPVWTREGGRATTSIRSTRGGGLRYRGQPVLGGWASTGLPIFVDSLTREPWGGNLADLIDGQWATDPTAIREGDGGVDAAGFQQYMAGLAMEDTGGRAKREAHYFLHANNNTPVMRLVTDQGAMVKTYPWRYSEVPMPSKEHIIQMPWKYMGTEELLQS